MRDFSLVHGGGLDKSDTPIPAPRSRGDCCFHGSLVSEDDYAATSPTQLPGIRTACRAAPSYIRIYTRRCEPGYRFSKPRRKNVLGKARFVQCKHECSAQTRHQIAKTNMSPTRTGPRRSGVKPTAARNRTPDRPACTGGCHGRNRRRWRSASTAPVSAYPADPFRHSASRTVCRVQSP